MSIDVEIRNTPAPKTKLFELGSGVLVRHAGFDCLTMYDWKGCVGLVSLSDPGRTWTEMPPRTEVTLIGLVKKIIVEL